ncbi:HAD family hydrolase [Blastococcus sp. TBT05-19]|nr:HAD family hydrolase [Blastococcus sp. TBT05-19]
MRAVLFDWRGTLACTLDEQEWVSTALRRLGRPVEADGVAELGTALRAAEDDLDGPGVDSDADLHRRTYAEVFRRIGLDDDLAAALYAVESDPLLNPFADDVADVLGRLRDAGVRIGVVSDVHVDIRPAFAAAGLAELVDAFTLSAEQGMQKPDPRMFTRTLDVLGAAPAEALMVGDRSGPDGGAVEAGIPTLLLPPLRGPQDRRLDRVPALCGLSAPGRWGGPAPR